MVTLFYQTAIDHVYFYEIEFAKLIIRYRQSLCVCVGRAVHRIVQTQQIFPVLKQPAKNRVLVVSPGWQRGSRCQYRSISLLIHLSSFAGERKSPAFSLFFGKA